MSRQALTHCIIRNKSTGSEKAVSALEVVKRKNGTIELALSESVYDILEEGYEILLISDRGTCWHRFNN